MDIREWRRDDLPAVGALLEELAAAIGEDFRPEAERLEALYVAMRKDPEVYRSFVCEEGGAVVGFVSLVLYASVFHRKGTALVAELVVAAAARGRGVGAALLARAEELARAEGMDELEVGVVKGNARAIAFYKAAGLTEEYLLLGKELNAASR